MDFVKLVELSGEGVCEDARLLVLTVCRLGRFVRSGVVATDAGCSFSFSWRVFSGGISWLLVSGTLNGELDRADSFLSYNSFSFLLDCLEWRVMSLRVLCDIFAGICLTGSITHVEGISRFSKLKLDVPMSAIGRRLDKTGKKVMSCTSSKTVATIVKLRKSTRETR